MNNYAPKALIGFLLAFKFCIVQGFSATQLDSNLCFDRKVKKGIDKLRHGARKRPVQLFYPARQII